MSNPSGFSSDLQTLQQEVAELKEYKRKKELENTENSAPSEELTDDTGSQTSSLDDEISEDEVQNITDQMEHFFQNVGEIELEHPALTLVAVFTLGAVIGHLLSRR